MMNNMDRALVFRRADQSIEAQQQVNILMVLISIAEKRMPVKPYRFQQVKSDQQNK